jgi:hypothetical protein
VRVSLVAALLASLSLISAAPAVSRPASPIAHAACTNATIEGDRRCIARGQYCRHSRRANRDYHRYGYHCGKRDARGSYHLVYH